MTCGRRALPTHDPPTWLGMAHSVPIRPIYPRSANDRYRRDSALPPQSAGRRCCPVAAPPAGCLRGFCCGVRLDNIRGQFPIQLRDGGAASECRDNARQRLGMHVGVISLAEFGPNLVGEALAVRVEWNRSDRFVSAGIEPVPAPGSIEPDRVEAVQASLAPRP